LLSHPGSDAENSPAVAIAAILAAAPHYHPAPEKLAEGQTPSAFLQPLW